jgi:hypothetical protein
MVKLGIHDNNRNYNNNIIPKIFEVQNNGRKIVQNKGKYRAEQRKQACNIWQRTHLF